MPDYSNHKHSELTSQIIKSVYYVYNYFGFGHLESVYEKALMIKLQQMGLEVKDQEPIKVYFEGALVGNFRADLIVNDLVIIELKAVERLHPRHEVQLVNYLKCTEIEVGLLVNFGEEIKVKRRVFSNDFKRRKRYIP